MRMAQVTAQPDSQCPIESGEKFFPVMTKMESSTIPVVENTIVFCTFIALGNSALSFCSFFFLILYSLNTLVAIPFKGSLVSLYTTVSFLFGVVFLLNLVKFKTQRFVSISLTFSLFSILFCSILTFVQHRLVKSILIHILAGLGGGLTFLFQNAVYIKASQFPRNYLGAVSLGFGLSGLMSFLLWITLSEILYPSSKYLVLTLWYFALIGILVSNLVAVGLWETISEYSWVQKALNINSFDEEAQLSSRVGIKKESIEPNAHQQTTTSTSSSILTDSLSNDDVYDNLVFDRCSLFRFMWFIRRHGNSFQQTINISLTLLVTFLMYPNIAPLAWEHSTTQHTLLMGLFLLGDFLGRYIPNLRHWYPKLVVGPKKVICLVLLRIMFIPWILFLRSSGRIFSSSLSLCLQYLTIYLFSLSNGWLCSLCNIYVFHSSYTQKQQERLFTVYLLCLLGGISLGTWFSPLFHYIP